MYSITDLAKIYNCSRQTIYTKFASEDIKPHIIEGEKGKGQRLTVEGFNILNVLMGDSRVNIKKHENGNNDEIDFSKENGKIVELLMKQYQIQTDELRQQVEYFKAEIEKLQTKNDSLVDEIMQRQKMLEDSATKEKRSFLDRLLKR
jgi:predicted RNase H-like nuclease (RuvC/YqgF family)